MVAVRVFAYNKNELHWVAGIVRVKRISEKKQVVLLDCVGCMFALFQFVIRSI
jgi:hypothetical protein